MKLIALSYILKAYPLGGLCMISVTSIWLQKSWQHAAAAADASVHTSVNILGPSFAWSLLLFRIFLKAYPLGGLRSVSAGTKFLGVIDDPLCEI